VNKTLNLNLSIIPSMATLALHYHWYVETVNKGPQELKNLNIFRVRSMSLTQVIAAGTLGRNLKFLKLFPKTIVI
jgi:hypothetical protein